MTPKSMLLSGALVALMTAVLTLTLNAQARDRDRDPAQARAQAQAQQGEDCKESLNAAGRAKFRPFTRQREIEGRGAAMADAVANWQRDVITKYGRQYMLWEKARDATRYCGPASPGGFGALFIGCTVQASPCNANEAQEPSIEPPDEAPSCEDVPRHLVIEAQRRMNGCDACNREISVDGSCGPQTQQCLRRFQRQNGLKVSGVPDRATMRALRECSRG